MKRIYSMQNFIYFKIVITIIASMISVAARGRPLSARIDFIDDNYLYLYDIKIDSKQSIRAWNRESDSLLTIDFDTTSSIDIEDSESASNYRQLTLFSNKQDKPLIFDESSSIIISGTGNVGEIPYYFYTNLEWCKKITFMRYKTIVPVSQKDKISCKITSTNGSSKVLSDIGFFNYKESETGYAEFSIRKITKNIYGKEYYLYMPVKHGMIGMKFIDIKCLDFSSGFIELHNDSIMNIIPNINWPKWWFNHLEPVRAISGFSNNKKYCVIESKDILKITDIRIVPSAVSQPETPLKATPLKKVSITGDTGKDQILESVTIVSPLSENLCIGRILMNRLKPYWCIADNRVCSKDEFLNAIAVKQDNFWHSIPISKIKRINKKNNKISIVLVSGESIFVEKIELGVIRGDGNWGEVKYKYYNHYNFFSFEIIQY